MQNLAAIVTGFFKTTFSSLKYRDFRLFWFGQCISLTGTWMQRTAQVWLVYTLTKSPFMVGIIGVCQFMPMLLFSLFAGVIVDRFPKKNIIIFTQLMFMAQAAVMTVLTFTKLIKVEHILVLSAVYGMTQTLDMPARQSFFVDLVGRENLMNAVSLNSTIVNLARIVGPAVSGLVMVRYGMVFCFFINAVSFIPVITGIILIKANGGTLHHVTRRVLPEISEGLRYIAKNETLVIDVLLMAAICTFAMNNDAIIPVFAQTVLGRGANGYTGLLSASGIGSFIAAIFMAYISRRGTHKGILIIAGAATAVLQILTVVTRQYVVCALLIGMIGFVNLAFLNTANSVFQLTSSDEYRGRVMSVYSFLNQGSTPAGNFFAGTVMEYAGGDSGFVSCGAAALLALVAIVAVKRKTITGWFVHSDK
jgi:MFS family permease